MTERIPSAILADFLDRFAVIMDFCEELDTFLDDEQYSVLDDYKVEYEKSLEIIKMIQELFMALSVSFAFLVSTMMLAPLLIEAPVENLLLYSLIGLILMDVGIIIAIRSFIPGDSILHSLPDKNLMQKKVKKWFFILLGFSVLLFLSLIFFTTIPFVLIVAISITPLLYPGFLARKEEELIKKRDVQFPVFVRVFGSAIEVRNGGVISALRATQIHDFRTLNAMNINLHRRLRLGSDKYKSWYYYAVESGSNIISNFSKIFSESVYIGGNAEKIGEIVSRNIQHLLSLRKLRRQIAQSITGVFYGITIGVSMTIFITYRIAEKMFELFNIGESTNETMINFASTIMPVGQDINFAVILVYITLMLVVHSFISSWVIKIIDGGSNYTLLINLIFMTWIIVVLYLTMPPLVDSVLPNMGNIWG
jgi:flagellar protein FlaJ